MILQLLWTNSYSILAIDNFGETPGTFVEQVHGNYVRQNIILLLLKNQNHCFWQSWAYQWRNRDMLTDVDFIFPLDTLSMG